MGARQVILKRGRFQAALEDGQLVIEGPGMAGELVRSRLPNNLDWLQQYLIFLEDAGNALAEKAAGGAKRR
jgi:hypothetical protein